MYLEVIAAADQMKAEKEKQRELEKLRDNELAEQYKKKLEELEIARREALQKLADRASKFQGNFIDTVLAKEQEKEAKLDSSIKAHMEKIEKQANQRAAEEKAKQKAYTEQMIAGLQKQQTEIRLKEQQRS